MRKIAELRVKELREEGCSLDAPVEGAVRELRQPGSTGTCPRG